MLHLSVRKIIDAKEMDSLETGLAGWPTHSVFLLVLYNPLWWVFWRLLLAGSCFCEGLSFT